MSDRDWQLTTPSHRDIAYEGYHDLMDEADFERSELEADVYANESSREWLP